MHLGISGGVEPGEHALYRLQKHHGLSFLIRDRAGNFNAVEERPRCQQHQPL
jgi:hypothetical protein